MHATRLALSLVASAALVGSAAGASAQGPAGDVRPHRHFIVHGETMIPVGPQVCGDPSMQFAFNQFHARVHVGEPGTFAMEHDHNMNAVVSAAC